MNKINSDTTGRREFLSEVPKISSPFCTKKILTNRLQEFSPECFIVFLNEIIKPIKIRCERLGITMTLEAPIPDHSSFVRPLEFFQIFENLLNNSLETLLEANTQHPWIAVSFTQPADTSNSYFCVSNNSPLSENTMTRPVTISDFSSQISQKKLNPRLKTARNYIAKHGGDCGYLDTNGIAFFHFTIPQKPIELQLAS